MTAVVGIRAPRHAHGRKHILTIEILQRRDGTAHSSLVDITPGRVETAVAAIDFSRSGIVAPEFVLVADAVKDTSGYESWSRLCLENLNALLAKAAAAGVLAQKPA